MMETVIRAVVLALAWFVALNATASVVSWSLVRFLPAFRHTNRPHLLLLVRLVPAAASLLFVAAIFLPSHWALEPRDAHETLGFAWYGLAAAGAFLLGRSAVCAASVARTGRRLRAGERGAAIAIADVHEVDGISGVSLAGVFRTRVLIGPAITDCLSAAELEVAVAHELAHRDAFDNLARWGMRCAPDFLSYTAVARRLEEAWHAAAEARADTRATAGDSVRALHLASALVKVARLGTAAPAVPLSTVWSTLHDAPLLEWRVRRLVSGVVTADNPRRSRALVAAVPFSMLLAAALTFSGAVHRLTEALVNLLP
jgi:hypothetical protein